MEFFTRLFDPSGFPARWQCGSGWAETPWLGWLHVFSDLGIWGAYFAIPVVLALFVARKETLPFRRLFLLFGAFICLCGLTHLTEAVIFWWPAYRFAGALKLLTALVSWSTVFALFSIVPAALALRTPQELEREIEARRNAERQLQLINEELESRVQARTGDLKTAIDLLSAERELLQTTLRSIGDGVIVTDANGDVTFINGVGETLTGWSSDDAKGLPLEQIFCIVNEETRAPVDNPALRSLREGMIVGLANHTILIAKDGQERPIDDSAAPIKSDTGIAGAVLVFRDITERKRNEQAIEQSHRELAKANDALRRSESGLQLAIDIAGLGTFEIDLSTDSVSVNTQGRQIYGWDDSQDLTFQYVQTFFHEDDKDMVMNQVGKALDPRGSKEFDVEQKIRRRDGEVRWIRVKGRTTFSNAESPDSVEVRHEPTRIVGIYQDVTSRRQMEDELRRTASELSDADRRKDEFLATLAHELRNPLAPLRNGVEILESLPSTSVDFRQTRQMMERQLKQMVRLVDDLLDVSRITRNKLELRKEQVTLRQVLDDAIDTSKPLIASRRHQLKVSYDNQPVLLYADPVRLSQVFTNLLNNAAKFTEPGGEIQVSVHSNDDSVTVAIADSGIGIECELLPKVFDMFTQLEEPGGTNRGGLGIGLTLVRRLVEMHDGSVTASSRGRNHGSQFSVTLPVAEGPQDSQPADSDLTAQATKPLRILVADDNVDAANTLSMMLRLMKHEVVTVYDGEQAVEATRDFGPDVAFLDIGMPKLNGHQAAKAIREVPLGKHVMLVAVTGWGQEEDRRNSKAAGFDHHLVKPVDPNLLRGLISKRGVETS